MVLRKEIFSNLAFKLGRNTTALYQMHIRIATSLESFSTSAFLRESILKLPFTSKLFLVSLPLQVKCIILRYSVSMITSTLWSLTAEVTSPRPQGVITIFPISYHLSSACSEAASFAGSAALLVSGSDEFVCAGTATSGAKPKRKTRVLPFTSSWLTAVTCGFSVSGALACSAISIL